MNRRSAQPWLLMAVAVLFSRTGTQAQRPMPAQTESQPVVVGVAVTNTGEDRYIDDLQASDILVTDAGQPQTVAALRRQRRPVSVCVVFDASQRDDVPEKYRIANAAVRALVGALEPDDEIAALVMRMAPEVRLPWTRASTVTTVDWGELPHRGWSLSDTMLAALDVLDRARHPRRVVLLLSDGITGGRRVSLTNIVTTRFRSETTVHAIELNIGMEPFFGRGYMPVRDRRIVKPQLHDSPLAVREPDPALPTMVEQGGGLMQRIGQVKDAEEAVRNVARDLQFEYTVEYLSTRPQDGRFHRVQVQVARRDARARHRAGYLATSADVRTSATVILPPPAQGATPEPSAAERASSPATGATPSRPAPPNPRMALRTTYEAAVDSFRSTRSFAGAELLVGEWSRETLSTAVSAVRRKDPSFGFAAAQFHLEVALEVAPRSPDNAGYHLSLGEQLLAALEADRDNSLSEHLDRWWATAASIFQAQTEIVRAKALAGRGLDRVKSGSRVQFVAAHIEELQALGYDDDFLPPAADRSKVNLERRGRLAVVERMYRRALALDPNLVAATVHLGRVLCLLDRFDDGRRVLEPIAVGASYAPGDRYLASLFLAADYERAGERDRARATLETIETFAPGRQTAWLALAQFEQRTGRVDRAREIVASRLQHVSDIDEWWGYRNGRLRVEDLEWLRARVSR